jgi:hypothetical protein
LRVPGRRAKAGRAWAQWTSAAVVAAAQIATGVLYVRLSWRRSPQAYRAMIVIGVGYFAVLVGIPYSAEQGISKREQGTIGAGTGNFSSNNGERIPIASANGVRARVVSPSRVLSRG